MKSFLFRSNFLVRRPLLLLTFVSFFYNAFPPSSGEPISVKCPPLPKLQVLPGRGWCNLRNKEMGQVQQLKYEECKTTPDGLYLIPDNLFILPIDESKVQLYSEIIDSWKNYSSLTAKSINANGDASFGSIVSISGSFSNEYQKCKQSQVNQKSVTTRVQARYTLYTVGTSVDEELHPKLLSQLRRAMESIKEGNVEEVDYLLELVVREYGSHLLTRLDAGAVISQEEYISRAYNEEQSEHSETIKVAASARFFSKFGLSASYSTTTNDTLKQSYEHNLRSSNIGSYGGNLFHPDYNISVWIDSIPSHPAAVDREGDPLHFIVSPATFPQEPLELVDTLRLELQGAISRYFAYNGHLGCMALEKKNFDYNANIDSGMCTDPVHKYSLGGLFQTCESSGDAPNGCGLYRAQKNMLTQGFSCPAGYLPVPLLEEGGSACVECGYVSWWWWGYVSKTCCSSYKVVSYWCAADADGPIANGTGLMFGGLYSAKMDNPMTQGKNCPPTFHQAQIFEDVTICVGNDYELGSRFSTDFGGFFSCQIGNPLYNRADLKRLIELRLMLGVGSGLRFPDLHNETTKACPPGYTQHTATIQKDCLVNYCVKAGSFSAHGEMPVVLPPFKNYTGIFSHMKAADAGKGGGDSGGGTGWKIVGGVVGALLLIVLIAMIAFKVRKGRGGGGLLPQNNVEEENLMGNDANDNLDD